MTILHTSQFKKGLWISFLTAFCVFGIFIIGSSAHAYDLGDYTQDHSHTASSSWILWDMPPYATTSFLEAYNFYKDTNFSVMGASECESGGSGPSITYSPVDIGNACVGYTGDVYMVRWQALCSGGDRTPLKPSCVFGYLKLNKLGPSSWTSDDDGPPVSSLTIDSPTSGSTASSTFSLNFTYNFQGEGWDKMYVVFEAWSASSTCPIYGTDAWQTEYNAGWFYNQSLPYFSPILTATSTSATSSIQVSNIDQPLYYNCNYCYFYNYEEATSTLVNKCPDYLLNVVGFISPSQPLPIGTWSSYYASHTDSKYPTSTPIFDTITGSFSDLVQKIASFVNDFRTLFDSQTAYAKGAELGAGAPLVRGYLKPINDFFGGLPVSELFIFCIIALLVVVVYRIVARILHLIRG